MRRLAQVFTNEVGVRCTYIQTESQDSIDKWGRDTFGDHDAMGMATRMTIEASELLLELVGSDPRLQQLCNLAVEIHEDISRRYHELRDGGQPAELYCQPTPKAPQECADVLIVLYQVAAKVNTELHSEVDRKMTINRARAWAKTADGRHQHVEKAP